MTVDTAAQEDDVIYIAVQQNPSSEDNYGVVTITGFTQIAEIDNTESGFEWGRTTLMRRVAGDSEGTTYTVNTTVSQDALSGVALTVIGANTAAPDPTIVTNEDTSTNTTADIPAITTEFNNSWDVVVMGCGGSVTQGFSNWLTSWGDSLVEDEDNANAWASIGLAHVIRASAGVQSATSVTQNAADRSLAIRFEVAKAVAAPDIIFPYHLIKQVRRGFKTLLTM